MLDIPVCHKRTFVLFSDGIGGNSNLDQCQRDVHGGGIDSHGCGTGHPPLF